MNLQELSRSATLAWSPLPNNPQLIATGTVAGTLGLDFDTSSHLEIFSLNIGKHNKEPTLLGSTVAADRFHKLVWGLMGVNNGTLPYGLLAGALSNGAVQIWNPEKIVNNGSESECCVSVCERSSNGAVMALDFNPFQPNLLASGSADSEITIWDFQNPEKPLNIFQTSVKSGTATEGSGISTVAWNKKVPYILASTTSNAQTSVWDLRTKKSIIQIVDRKLTKSRAMAWNPEEPTQLVVASEDDDAPGIFVWDLRNVHAPQVLQGHTKGVWGVSWCPMDRELLLSCGRDNQTLCWNMQKFSVQCEIDSQPSPPSTSTPSSDPFGASNPFQSKVSVWNTDIQWSPRIPALFAANSLDGKIRFFSMQDVQNVKKTEAIPVPDQAPPKPPKWLRRPVGATFGFGGKLAIFQKDAKNPNVSSVKVCQVSLEKDLLKRADGLEEALSSNSLKQFCASKIASATSDSEKSTWEILLALFQDDQRQQILKFLNLDTEAVAKELEKYTKSETPAVPAPVPVPEPKSEVVSEAKDDFFDNISATPAKPEPISQSVPAKSDFTFFDNEDVENAVMKAMLVGNFEAAVKCCFQAKRYADALVLAAYGGPELWASAQDQYLKSGAANKAFSWVVTSLVKDQLKDIVQHCAVSEWRNSLAIICTYAKKDHFPLLAAQLGDRLRSEKLFGPATICYLCAGHLENTVECWSLSESSKKIQSEQENLDNLVDLVEKVAVFRKAIRHDDSIPASLASKLTDYAGLLASQGRLFSAANTLSFAYGSVFAESKELLHRIYHALAQPTGLSVPPAPFDVQNVGGPVVAKVSNVPVNKPVVKASVMPVTSPAPAFNVQPLGALPPFGSAEKLVTPVMPVLPPLGQVTMPRPVPVAPAPVVAKPHSEPPMAHHPTSLLSNPLGVPSPVVPVMPILPKMTNPLPAPTPAPLPAPPMSVAPPLGNFSAPPIGNFGEPPKSTLVIPEKKVVSVPSPQLSNAQDIVKTLGAALETYESTANPKIVDDLKNKRVGPFYDQLGKGVSSTLHAQLSDFAAALLRGDKETTAALQMKIASDFSDELKANGVLAMKRFAELLK